MSKKYREFRIVVEDTGDGKEILTSFLLAAHRLSISCFEETNKKIVTDGVSIVSPEDVNSLYAILPQD